jgi:ribosomal protein S11
MKRLLFHRADLYGVPRKKLLYKSHFFFGLKKKKIAYLIMKRLQSNTLVTLLDMKHKVIICKTSGNVHVGFNKKLKKAPQALEKIIKGLLPYLRLYRIYNVIIGLKNNISMHLHLMIKELLYNKINVLGIRKMKRIAHNGMRSRKVRRI